MVFRGETGEIPREEKASPTRSVRTSVKKEKSRSGQ